MLQTPYKYAHREASGYRIARAYASLNDYQPAGMQHCRRRSLILWYDLEFIANTRVTYRRSSGLEFQVAWFPGQHR